MTSREAIETMLRNEVEKGQSAWELVQDGYDGDVDAYIEDYVDDYEAEDGIGEYIVKKAGTDESWTISKGVDVYTVIDEEGYTLLAAEDFATAYNYFMKNEEAGALCENGCLMSC